MNTRTINAQSSLFVVTMFLSITIFILASGGCASNVSGPGPGTPDVMQMQHYEMLVSAIEAKTRVDALAALALFEADIFRWHTNTLTETIAITELLALTDAVDKEDWVTAKRMLLELKSKYRPS